MSFYTSMTGLNAATTQLAVTSNNIANVGTTGFKRSRADFGDIFATSPLQKAASVVGQGVALKSVTQEFSQGNVQFSSSSLDMAITGDGFFPMKSADGLQDIYTRNGTFVLNDSFAVVNSAGQALMAASVDSSGKADLANLRKLYIPRSTTGDARQTENIKLALNLPADAPVISKAFDPADPNTYSLSTAVTVYDTGGNDYLATVYYVKTKVATPDDPSNKWQTHVYIGQTKLDEKLIQSTDAKGKAQYVNKYGEIRSENSVPPVQAELIARGTVKLFHPDDLKDLQPSVPATVMSYPALSDQLVSAWKTGLSGSDLTLPARTVDLSSLKTGAAPETGKAYSLSVGAASFSHTATAGQTWDDVAGALIGKVNASTGTSGLAASYSDATGLLRVDQGAGLSDISLSSTSGSETVALAENKGGMKFKIEVDGAVREIDFTSQLLGEDTIDTRYTGIEIARKLSNALNKAFGDERYYDLSSLASAAGGPAALFRVAIGEANSKDPVNTDHLVDIAISADGTGEGSLAKMTIEEVESKIAAEVAVQAAELRSKADDLTDPVAKAKMIAAADRLATLQVKYDPVERSFSYKAGEGEKVFLSSAGEGDNELFGLGQASVEVDLDSGFYGADMPPNGLPIHDSDQHRFGLKVEFDDYSKTFTVSTGATGDQASISISDASDLMASYFRFPPVGSAPIAKVASDIPDRGIASSPAVLSGAPIGMNTSGKFSVDSTNNKFVVTIDNVTGTVVMPPRGDYTIDSFRLEMERRINSLADSQGRTVSGVSVAVERNALGQSYFKVTSGTSGNASFIKVSANNIWGFSDDESARGETSQWTSPPQAGEATSDGGFRPLYVDRDGKETSSPGDFDPVENRNLWTPIFLDKGELTFDTSGKLVSPLKQIAFNPQTIGDAGATLEFGINYEGSTQFSSPFSVIAQSQDGAPEGDLIGLDISDAGLVSANYSNGTQKSLAKVVLANFSAPTGLRQVGEASYLATSASGKVTVGEAATAGFGTIRAGARERANVDLTQELIDLITAQRNFQANAKAIETNNTLTQAIINIRS